MHGKAPIEIGGHLPPVAGMVYLFGMSGRLARMALPDAVVPGAGVPPSQRALLVGRFTAAQAHMIRHAARKERVGNLLVDAGAVARYSPAVRVVAVRVRALAPPNLGVCDVFFETEGEPLAPLERAGRFRRLWWRLAAWGGRRNVTL